MGERPQSAGDVRLGRYLSLVLRHDPSAAGVRLDEHGWVAVDDLLAGASAHGHPLDRATLERIVRENAKHRYSLSADGARIRANQGHSVDVDVELTPAAPPPVLFHGTAARFVESIRESGITRQQRRYVHLSADASTAMAVGRRHGTPVVLRVDAAGMVRDGYGFWVSANGVWLCETVPREYVTVVPPDNDAVMD